MAKSHLFLYPYDYKGYAIGREGLHTCFFIYWMMAVHGEFNCLVMAFVIK
ncbi:hypothetical protein C4J98_1074 [Pseudomonas orientalis]|nr:hypothetical protein C4J98_1074 [Pseudomonas orientalis]